MKKGLWKAGGGGCATSAGAYRKESDARAKRRQIVLYAGVLCVFLNRMRRDADINVSGEPAESFEPLPHAWMRVCLNESLLEASVILQHRSDVIY